MKPFPEHTSRKRQQTNFFGCISAYLNSAHCSRYKKLQKKTGSEKKIQNSVISSYNVLVTNVRNNLNRPIVNISGHTSSAMYFGHLPSLFKFNHYSRIKSCHRATARTLPALALFTPSIRQRPHTPSLRLRDPGNCLRCILTKQLRCEYETSVRLNLWFALVVHLAPDGSV